MRLFGTVTSRPAFFVPILALTVCPALAQRRPKPKPNPVAAAARVDMLIGDATSGTDTKALFAVVVERGKIVYSKGFGDSGGGHSPTLNTVFYIGSLSKAVTGFGLMELVDKGKVSLSAPVSQYVPGLPAEWARIPVLNYVTHTSGLPNVPGKAASFDKAVEKAAAEPMLFPPGSSQSYNNFNFSIAGQIIEHVSGQSYLDYMKKNVFEPSGMTSTGVGITQKLTEVKAYPNVAAYGTPSGGLESSGGDLVRWFQFMLRNGGMSPRSYKAMHTPLVPTATKRNSPWHFTPGWQARFANGDEIVAKDGGVVGFFSMMQMVPSKGVCVILLESHEGPGKNGTHLWPLAANILRDIYGYPVKGSGEGEGGIAQ